MKKTLVDILASDKKLFEFASNKVLNDNVQKRHQQVVENTNNDLAKIEEYISSADKLPGSTLLKNPFPPAPNQTLSRKTNTSDYTIRTIDKHLIVSNQSYIRPSGLREIATTVDTISLSDSDRYPLVHEIDGKYKIIDGNHRLLCYMILNKPLTVRVLNNPILETKNS